ncbi:hypothetical protein CEXT_150441 [Caerostris extrusa]|uniref:Uncharacterized protein n=1 Tax=Caerostris extrusa TaxID=172846 RepID=A0AAV4XKJ8_CAEEX|nr:hypothetical protein CEXT_150441 [Caerostris extrusa]
MNELINAVTIFLYLADNSRIHDLDATRTGGGGNDRVGREDRTGVLNTYSDGETDGSCRRFAVARGDEGNRGWWNNSEVEGGLWIPLEEQKKFFFNSSGRTILEFNLAFGISRSIFNGIEMEINELNLWNLYF